MSPSSRLAASWKPSVAYLDLNFCPLWKKQTTLPSLAYAGMPYQQVNDERQVGNLALNLRDLDRRQALMALFGAGISPIAKEEGWILGVEPDPHAEGRARHGDS